MANPTLTQNRKQTDPSLADLLKLHMREIMLNLNCHAVATVQSFDAATQTVTATINYTRSIKQLQADGTYRITNLDYPLLLDVPVVVLRGGAWALTFPISAGDECLVLFNDRDLDNWFQSGQNGPVATPRLHSFSDGIALVGLRSSPNVIEDYDETRAKLFNGETMVGVSATQVKIANELYTLNGVLQDLVTNLNSLITQTAAITVICSTPGNASSPPVNVAAITAIAAQLATTATEIGNLLE